ncbi:FAD-dependent oxidoreductase [Candidatus Hodarchaeum mangrovi]
MTKEYDLFIAGGGLGGLLCSTLLSKEKKSIFLAERLPFFGGRFTAMDYEGFQIPTGAVHMIPHGKKGPLGQILLRELNLPVPIIENEYFTTWYWPPKKDLIKHKHFWGIFRALTRFQQYYFVIRKLLLKARKSDQFSNTFHEFLEENNADPEIFQFFNAITGFALSLDISEIPTAEMFRFLKRLYERGRPGVPQGGCKTVINALVQYSEKNNVNLNLNTELIKLEIDGSEISSVACVDRRNGEEFDFCAKQYILNLGHPQINKILERSNLPFRLPSTPVARGGGFIFQTDASLLKRSTVAQFPTLDYVKGAVEPTLNSSGLAPNGKTMFITHQVFHTDNIVKETQKAREEIFQAFPDLEEKNEICIHTFHKTWPVNFAVQGHDLPNHSTEISNLYFVGDGFKGKAGWIMTEGVAYGAKQIVINILHKNN